MKFILSNKKALILGAICVLTFICFRYSLHNQFTNWDDDVYISNDQYIKALNPSNIKTIFTEDITKNNYHPLCMLSLALNYHFTQLEPATYYLTNILIHIANVILVFLLLSQVCARLKIEEQGALFIASFGAMWFGIHPMHVESVSWIAERKDVLYTFFYLAGLITYLKYSEENKQKWYWITFLLFILSCLSKPMAVVFPLSLVCFDFLFNGKLDKKLIIAKIPFFLASLVCGGFAYYTQNKTGAIAPFGILTLQERIMYAAYGFMMYIYKLFNPTFLSTFYPYPYRYITGWLPSIYYLAPVISIAILAIPLYCTYKKNRSYFRILAFGYGFFIANIIFVLQFISCGAAIMADRYSYVAYIGLFFVIAYFIWEIIKRFPDFKLTFIVVVLGASLELSYLCYQRTFVWHNSETLLKDAIQKYPYRALLSYKWLGNYYMDLGQMDKALESYNVLTSLNAADARIYDNVGNIYRMKNDYDNALKSFDKSLHVQHDVYKTYLDISLTYAMIGDSANTIKYYLTAYQMNPLAEKTFADAGFNMVQTKQYKGAIVQYNALLLINPNNPFYYFYRGVAKFGEDKMQAAAADWTIAVKFKSQDVQPVAAYNLSVAEDSLGHADSAMHYATMAKDIGYKVDSAYLNKLKGKLRMKR
jgi:tetratricopeptide (TPR) repeat protein